MTEAQKSDLRKVFINAINEIGLPVFKQMSIFGSNDPAALAAKAAKLKQAA